VLNVQKIINVNKRIYCEKTYKQTLIVNADISPRFINYVGLPVVNIFTVRASSKFQFIGAVASIIHFQTVCKNIQSLASYCMLRFTSANLFYISCEVH